MLLLIISQYLQTNSTISGRVTIDGNSPSYNLQLSATNPDSGNANTYTDNNGYFTFHVSNKINNYTIGTYSYLPIGYNNYTIIAHPGQTNANLNFTTTGIKQDNSNMPTAFGLS